MNIFEYQYFSGQIDWLCW